MSSPPQLDDLLATLTADQRAAFLADYQTLRDLPAARGELQAFFDGYLLHLVRLYAATAGALWFRPGEPGSLVCRARIGFDRLDLTGDLQRAHEQLLNYALDRDHSFLVRPFSAPARGTRVSNPTDSFVILGPVSHGGQRIALVELLLGPTPVRGQSAAERNRYLLWLDHLITFLCRGMEIRLLRTSAPLPAALDQLATTELEVQALQDAIRQTLQQRLSTFAGWNFGSLEKNQAFATRVHELLEQHGLRVVCPQCGSPAILRCQNSGNARTGVFLFDHYLETGRTFHGGPTTVPPIRLVAKPARRKSAGSA
ncbi:MAG: hypothetical protein AB7O38_11530 [Pirellulaceae bacterium]